MNNSGTNLQVIDLILVKTPGYKDQFLRPINVDVSYNVLNQMEGQIVDKMRMGVDTFSGGEIAKFFPDLSSISSTPLSVAKMSYGWGQERGLFVLKVQEQDLSGYGARVYLVQGYTTHWGVSNGGHIDETMDFHINSIVTVHKSQNSNGGINTRVIGYHSVMSDPTTNEKGFVRNREMELLLSRPEDVTTVLTQEKFLSGMDSDGSVIRSSSASYDGVGGGTPVLAERRLNIPTANVSDVLTATMRSKRTADLSYSSDIDTLDQTASYLTTDSIFDNGFLKALSAFNGYRETTVFNKNALINIDPSISHRPEDIHIPVSGNYINTSGFTANDSEDLYKPTIENKLVTLAVEGIAGLLSEFMLTGADVVLDNSSGKFMVSVVDPKPMLEGLNVERLVNLFQNKIVEDLMPVLTHNNQMLVTITADVSMVRDAMVKISVDGGVVVPYLIPVFADSTFSNILTDTNTFTNNVNSFREIINQVLSPKN